MLKKLFKRTIREYIPIETRDSEIIERIYVDAVDVSKNVILVSLNPIMYAIWKRTDELWKNYDSITIKSGDRIIVTLTGKVETEIILKDQTLMLWRPKKVAFFGISFFEKEIVFRQILSQSRKGKFKFSMAELQQLSASYFYPRKVYLVIIKAKDYLNIFPMDLHLKNPYTSNYLFALQPSNHAEEIIRENRQIVVCEIGSDKLEAAYALGKNHGHTNLYQQKLGFDTTQSAKFNFPIPDFNLGYREVLVDEYCNFEGHTLFLGRIANEEIREQGSLQPYHIHRFHYNYCIGGNQLSEYRMLHVS